MLQQSLSLAGPGISAGLEFVTPKQWRAGLAQRYGLAEKLTAWDWPNLEFAIWEQLPQLAASGKYRLLSAHLSPDPSVSSARAQATASRLARAFRHYLATAPQLLRDWLQGAELDLAGNALADHLAWQPELLRRIVQTQGIDPCQLQAELVTAVSQDQSHGRLASFAVAELSQPEFDLLEAHGKAAELQIWQLPSKHLPDWATPLADRIEELTAGPVKPPVVFLHGSHGELRQAQVLRDQLCQILQADPSLEPRDIAICVPDLNRWWPKLHSVFAPLTSGAGHPGRGLRLPSAGVVAEENQVLTILAEVLLLEASRATASQLIELFSKSPIAQRWQLSNRERLTELVASAGISWGLDPSHRSQHGLAGLVQNTWLSGLDRLLAGVALPADQPSHGLVPVAGVETSDLELIGNLCELLSRLRKFSYESSSAAPAAVWVKRSLNLLSELVGSGPEDDWMQIQALAGLNQLAEQTHSNQLPLSRQEFAQLVTQLAQAGSVRTAVGNGNLQLIEVGDLLHVGFKVVCLLGISDNAPAELADVIELPDQPSRRQLQLARLFANASVAEQLVIVQQTAAETTNLPVAAPTATSWLLRELGVEAELKTHPLTAHSAANFQASGSFDTAAATAAQSLMRPAAACDDAVTARRRSALQLPVVTNLASLEVTDLVSFLRDPAKEFLKSAAKMRIFETPSLRDQVPLLLDSLDAWQLRDRLLSAAKSGASYEQVIAAEKSSGNLPPGKLGAIELATQSEAVGELWELAGADWRGQLQTHPIALNLDDPNISIRGQVRTRGGKLVALSSSSKTKPLLAPWVELLLLAAAGIRCDAVSYHLEKFYGKLKPKVVRLAQPDPQTAKQHLSYLARASWLAKSRLIALPLEPAVRWVQQQLNPKKAEKEQHLWKNPKDSYSDPWRYRGDWELFFNGPASELFDDPATEFDPPAEQFAGFSGFERWSNAIIKPLIQGSQQ